MKRDISKMTKNQKIEIEDHEIVADERSRSQRYLVYSQ